MSVAFNVLFLIIFFHMKLMRSIKAGYMIVCIYFAVNMDGKPGACGFVPVILRHILPAYLIKVDEETGEPLRDENGLCIMCKPGKWTQISIVQIENCTIHTNLVLLNNTLSICKTKV